MNSDGGCYLVLFCLFVLKDSVSLKIIPEHTDQAAVVGCNARLVWGLNGQNYKTSVFKKSQTLHNDRKYYIDRSQDDKVTLCIKNVNLDDGGIYRCQMDSTDNDGNIHLNITDFQWQNGLQTKPVDVGDTVTILWKYACEIKAQNISIYRQNGIKQELDVGKPNTADRTGTRMTVDQTNGIDWTHTVNFTVRDITIGDLKYMYIIQLKFGHDCFKNGKPVKLKEKQEVNIYSPAKYIEALPQDDVHIVWYYEYMYPVSKILFKRHKTANQIDKIGYWVDGEFRSQKSDNKMKLTFNKTEVNITNGVQGEITLTIINATTNAFGYDYVCTVTFPDQRQSSWNIFLDEKQPVATNTSLDPAEVAGISVAVLFFAILALAVILLLLVKKKARPSHRFGRRINHSEIGREYERFQYDEIADFEDMDLQYENLQIGEIKEVEGRRCPAYYVTVHHGDNGECSSNVLNYDEETDETAGVSRPRIMNDRKLELCKWDKDYLKGIITKHLSILKEHLSEVAVINEIDLEDIDVASLESKQNGADKLIAILQQRGQDSLPQIISVLETCNLHYDVEKLKKDNITRLTETTSRDYSSHKQKDIKIDHINSKERGPMTGEELRRMKEVKLKLIDGISDPQPICDYLADEGILLPEHKHAIDMVDSPIKKTIKLLNFLIKEYKGSFPVFVNGLKETHHYSLAKLLEEWPNEERQTEIIEEDKDFVIKQLETTIGSGNIDGMKTLLKQLKPDDFRRLSYDFIKLTHKAIARRNLPLLQCLFTKCLLLQSDINLSLKLLTCAIKYDFVDGIKYLYSRRLSLQIGHEGKLYSALAESVKFNSLNTVKYLLSITDKHLKPDHNYSILKFSTSGAINGMDGDGNTPLKCALLYHRHNIDKCKKLISLLIGHGADMNRMEGDEDTPLTCAIRYHVDNIDTCIQLVSFLIKHGADINRSGVNGTTPLTCAIRCHGDNLDTCIKLVSFLIESRADINQMDSDGMTPFTCAILNHLHNIDTCIKLVSLLIQYKADINRMDGGGDTPLTCAILYQRDNIDTCIKLVSFLIKHGADINRLDVGGTTPFQCAIRCHGDNIDTCIKVVSFLIEHGADINRLDRDGLPPLTCAILYHRDNIDKCIKLVSLLIQHGANINGMDGQGFTPLKYAILYHSDNMDTSMKLMSLLIKHGADINGVSGTTPLTCAIRCHGDNIDTCIKVVSFLIEHGADINGQDGGGETPLMCTILCHRDNIDTCIKLVSLLIRYRADINGMDGHGFTPLKYAILYHRDNIDTSMKLIPLLIKQGADINGVSGTTHLTCAIRCHGDNIDACLKLISLLIKYRADINGEDGGGNTPLICAILYHRDNMDTCIKLVSLLIQHGADINRINKSGFTPLAYAIRYHGDKCIKLISFLIKNGVDINGMDGRGFTPLALAIQCHGDNRDTCIRCHGDNIDACLELISLLINYRADINGEDGGGNTPLICAILSHRDNMDTCIKLVSLLIQHGADINRINKSGFTPLAYAIRYHGDKIDKCIKLISFLIKNGVDINGMDGRGFTPLALAIQCHGDNRDTCIQLISLLIENGADVRQKKKGGITPLMTATQHATHTDIIKLVLGDEDNVNSIDDDGLSACRYCFKRDNFYSTKRCNKTTLNIFQFLVESGADIVGNGVQLLHDILTFGNLQIFKYYIGLKSPVADVTDQTNENIFHLLAKVKYSFEFDKLNWLFNHGGDINSRDSKTNTPVITAGCLLNNRYLEFLIKQGRICDVNIQNKVGQTALHAAIIGCSKLNRRFQDAEVAECKKIVSIENPIKEYKHQDSKLTGELKQTLKMNYSAFKECVDVLKNAKVVFNIQDSNGKTALMLAATNNDIYMTKTLLDKGSNLHLLDNQHGSSALQFLCVGCGRKCLRLFVTQGGHTLIDLPGTDGHTLIQRALLFPTCCNPSDTIGVIRILIAENCCLQKLKSTETNYYNDLTLDMFDSEERHKLRQLLYRSGAPVEEIVSTINYEMEDSVAMTEYHLQSPSRLKFKLFCFNISLKDKCVRIIRQHIGFDVNKRVEQLDIPSKIKAEILLVDHIPKSYFRDNYIDGSDDIFDSGDEDVYMYYDRHICNRGKKGDHKICHGIVDINYDDVYNYEYYKLDEPVNNDEEQLSSPEETGDDDDNDEKGDEYDDDDEYDDNEEYDDDEYDDGDEDGKGVN